MSDNLRNRVLRSIREESDGDDTPGTHALVEVNDSHPRFYIVVTTAEHEGRDYVNVRYFRFNTKHDTGTFLKNGINMRHEHGLVDALTDALDGVDERTLGYERDEPEWYSINDVGE